MQRIKYAVARLIQHRQGRGTAIWYVW